jgi:protein required for attachment to host cells
MRMDQGAWVLVADGEKFLLLRNVGNRARVALEVIDSGTVDNPPTRAQGTDRPGRLDHAAAGPSTVQETDWHRLEKERFAKDLADHLQGWALAGRYGALVLVADPRTLGVLRPELHKAVQERLVAEVDKDLTGMPVSEIEAVLAAA